MGTAQHTDADLEACITETVGLMARAISRRGHDDGDALLCELELLLATLEELADGDGDSSARADAEAVLAEARRLCAGEIPLRQPLPERRAA